MRTRPTPFRQLALLAVLTAVGGTAEAASLALVPSANTVTQNNPFTVDLVLNALDLTNNQPGRFGGKVVVNFDQTLLSYGSFVLKPGVANLRFFSDPVVATSGNQKSVTFGFDYAPVSGVVGTFTFTPLGNPNTLATVGMKDFSQTIGTFFSYTPTYQRVYPTITGTQVNISAVPLPAGVWLLGTAVVALAARRRFRHAAR
jgi:hypothetical protein